MFPKVWTSLTILLVASLEVHAHAAVAPVLGLGSTAPKRANVKRPNNLSPCGLGVNVAQSLAKSTPVQAAADGTFTVTATNFNAGRDGSRQFTAQVDAAATGKNFAAMTITQNGEAAPASTGSEDIVASLPSGTKCTGGDTQDLCLVSFKSLGGFGNCVAVQQGAGGAAGSSNTTASTASGSTAANSTSTDSTATGSTTNSTSTDSTATGDAAAGGTSTNSTTTDTSAAAGASGSSTDATAGTGGAANTGNNGKGKGKGQQVNVNNGGGAGKLGASTSNGNHGASAGAGGAGSQGNQNFNSGRLSQGGSRAARALLADLEERGEEMVGAMRRGLVNWVWA